MKKILALLLTFILCFVFIGCKDDGGQKISEQSEIDRLAKSILLSTDQIEQDTELLNKVGAIYDVTWELEENENCVLEKNGDKYVIKLLENYEWSNAIKLTATVHGFEDKSLTAKKEFSIYVRMKTADAYTIAQIFSSEVPNNTEVLVTGTVYQVCPQGIWITDAENSYLYVYTKSAPTAKEGNLVKCVGTKELYYTMYELTNPSVEVLDAKEGYDKASITKVARVEDLVANIPADSSEKPDNKKYGGLYTIEGRIVENTLGSSYDYMLESVLTDSAVALYNSAFATGVLDNLKANVGKYVRITGLYWDMHSDRFIRFVPIADVVETEIPELTDEDILTKVEGSIKKLAGEISIDMNLKTEMDGASITWTSSKPEVLDATGKILKQESNAIDVELTATIAINGKTKEVKITVTVMPLETMSVLSLVQLALTGEEKTVRVIGKIVELDNSDYFYVADETGITYVRTKITNYDGYAVGDVVDLVLKTSLYLNSNKEVAPQSSIIAIEKSTKEVSVVASESVEMSALTEKITFDSTLTDAEIKVIKENKLYGKIVKIRCYVSVRTSGSYTNVYLAGAEGSATPAAYYQHTSKYQNELKAFDGKWVELVAPLYGYSASYGWRLGTYLSVTEAK